MIERVAIYIDGSNFYHAPSFGMQKNADSSRLLGEGEIEKLVTKK